MPCIPGWIHTINAERARAKAIGMLGKDLGASGVCVPDANGTVPCDPESMRARTEAQAKALGLYPAGKHLSLDAYSLARNIGSEVGSGTVVEKVFIANAALNRLKLGDKRSISDLVMRNGNRYAKQSGSNPSVASSKNPAWDELVIAEMALAGAFGDFGGGVTHYFNPRIMDAWGAAGKGKNAAQTYETWSHGWGSDRYGWMWVGPVPGIDTTEHMLMRRTAKGSAEWQAAYPLGKAVMRQAGPEARALPCPSLTALTSSPWAAPIGLGLLTAVTAVGLATLYRRRGTRDD